MVTDKTGILTCIDAKTGEEHWHERIGGNYSASPLFADGKIYLQSEEGPAIVIQPGRNFQKLADAGFKDCGSTGGGKLVKWQRRRMPCCDPTKTDSGAVDRR